MATPKKLPSGRWRCQVYIGRGADNKKHYRTVTGDTRKEAVAKAAMLEDRPRKNRKVTVVEAVRQYIDLRRAVMSPATIRGYEKILRCNLAPIAGMPASMLVQEDIQQLVNELSHTVGEKTIRNVLGLLRPSLRGFVASDVFEVNLPQKKPSELHIPSQETAQQLAEAVHGLEIELPVLLAMQCGLRMSEVLGVKKSDADFSAHTLTIRRALVQNENGAMVEKQPKSFRGNRTVPMTPRVAELLAEVDGMGYAVPLSAAAIAQRLDHVMRRAGIPHMRFHDLRHYYASVCLLLNVPERYAMEFMGHSTPGMLKRYQHTMDEEKKRLGAEISDFFR